MNIEKHPLMLWHIELNRWVWWPNGKLKFWVSTSNAICNTNLLNADYGKTATLILCRCTIGQKGQVENFERVGVINSFVTFSFENF
jgi:hypothetical protein